MGVQGEQLGTMAAEEESLLYNLYREENISEKGISCIAINEIKKGSLLLREFPQLLISDQMIEYDYDNLHKNVIGSFLNMSVEDQERYMELYNMYDEDSEKWSDGIKEILNEALLATNGMVFSNISKENALKVWGIYKTNAFTNGVFLKMSRFNHSCHPNAAMSCRVSNTQDVRALRKIKQGEEITICYTDSNESLWSREERRAELKSLYNFDCNCDGCDMTAEQILQENENIAAFKHESASQRERRNLFVKMPENQQNELRFNFIKDKVKRAKQMYKLAKKVKPIHMGWILNKIVNQGFNGSCWCVVGQFNQGDDEEDAWKEKARWFAKVGLKIARTLYGPDFRQTLMWEERFADPIKFFLKYTDLK